MTVEPTSLPTQQAGPTKMFWAAPTVQILDLYRAEGATAGPLCDKHGSLSATAGNDSCTGPTKP